MKKKIKLQASNTNDIDFGIKLSVDNKVITNHLEVETPVALQGLLREFGHTDDEFEVIDKR
jgi:hypothetical protein